VSDSIKNFIFNSFRNEIASLLGDAAAEYDVESLSRDAVNMIDWDNPVLMHKDIHWLAEYYLRVNGILM